MRTIAHKNVGAGIVYIVLAAVGIIAAVTGVFSEMIPMIIVGALFTLLGGFFAVKFLTIPMEIIKVDTDGRIYLPKGVILYPTDIIDISYDPAKARGIAYKWGDVTITARGGVYTCSFVAECESVAKELTEIMYRAKFERESF